MPDADLERFHDGYRRHFDQALAEINGGRKRSHWMWFIFPQVAGLGTSPTAVHYAIRDRTEAEAFLRDPVLGPGYRTLVDAVWRQVIGAGVIAPRAVRPARRPQARLLAHPLRRCRQPARRRLDADRRPGQRDPRPGRDAGSAAMRHHTTIPRPAMLDPDTAPLDELDRELAQLQRQLPDRQPRSRRARRPPGRHRRRHTRLVDRRPPRQVATPVRAQRNGGDPPTRSSRSSSARTGSASRHADEAAASGGDPGFVTPSPCDVHRRWRTMTKDR